MISLDEYASIAQLSGPVRELRTEAAAIIPRLKRRKLWMVNSTAQGGGVAEMLPRMISIFEELGLPTEWAVLNTDRQDFFALTKNIHNLIHGKGELTIDDAARRVFEEVNRANADGLRELLSPDAVLIVHDPQPAPLGAFLKKEVSPPVFWRCHIGLDTRTPETNHAWDFLQPYLAASDHSIFTAPEYIPDYLAGDATVITPALDPLSHKNRELSPVKIAGILCNTGLATAHAPVLTPAFDAQAQRLQADGAFGPATEPDEIGFFYRPIVTQVSRWDRLKGFKPLLDAFLLLKKRGAGADADERQRRRIEIDRLVLAGPDPASVSDDPEGKEVLEELCATYRELPPELQRDVVILSLPMDSAKENALMVNAIQRCSSVVVQNSLREGFGLTATEAMWKRVPVLGTHAGSLRTQIRDQVDGVLVNNPEDREEVAAALGAMLGDHAFRDKLGRSAQRRVYQEFLVFTQVRRILEVLATHAAR